MKNLKAFKSYLQKILKENTSKEQNLLKEKFFIKKSPPANEWDKINEKLLIEYGAKIELLKNLIKAVEQWKPVDEWRSEQW